MKVTAPMLQLLFDVAEHEVVWDSQRIRLDGTFSGLNSLGAVEKRELIDYQDIEGERYRMRVVLTEKGKAELAAADGVFI